MTAPTITATDTDWKRRYRAARLSLPTWARDNPERLVYTSNASGKYEVYAWDRKTNEHRQVTDRPAGTGYMVPPRLDPAGKRIYWFDDAKGNELGHFRVELFGRGGSEPILEDLAPAYSARIAIASVVVGGLAALAVSLVLPKQYRATAQLFVAPAANPTVALQQVILGQNLATSYVQLAKAEVVLRPAMDKVGWKDLKTFNDRTKVSQVPNTFVILVSFDLDDPGRAADTANAIADSFVSQSSTVQSALQGTVSVWQRATAPTEPESPRVALNTVLGALAGGLVALLVIGIVTYLDDRVSDFDQVRSRLGLAPLGEVDRVSGVDSVSGRLFVRENPNSIEAEAFRSLRTNIAFANVDKPPRSILVTSALPLEGKSVVSANLALAFAQAGTPTILIDADLRRPSQHQLFKLDASAGLTSLLAGGLAADDLNRFRVGPNLLVIPCGPIPPDPAELLASAKMSALIRQLSSLADSCVVLIDTSPVLAVADPMALATKVDGCLLVVDAGRTSVRACHRAIDRLSAVKAPVLGVVLNKVSVAGSRYGYGYYGREAANPVQTGASRSGQPNNGRSGRQPTAREASDRAD